MADWHAPPGVACATPAPNTGTAATARKADAARAAGILGCCERDKVSLCGSKCVGGGCARVTDAGGRNEACETESLAPLHSLETQRSEVIRILVTFHNSRQSFTSSPCFELITTPRSPAERDAARGGPRGGRGLREARGTGPKDARQEPNDARGIDAPGEAPIIQDVQLAGRCSTARTKTWPQWFVRPRHEPGTTAPASPVPARLSPHATVPDEERTWCSCGEPRPPPGARMPALVHGLRPLPGPGDVAARRSHAVVLRSAPEGIGGRCATSEQLPVVVQRAADLSEARREPPRRLGQGSDGGSGERQVARLHDDREHRRVLAYTASPTGRGLRRPR